MSILQVAAWDANLVTPHKRMGNSGINLDSLFDGKCSVKAKRELNILGLENSVIHVVSVLISRDRLFLC